MGVETAEKARAKQFKLGIFGFFGFVGLLIFGFWANDPNKNKMSIVEIAEKQAREVEKSFSADRYAVSSEETWISKSEVELASLRDRNDGLENRIKQLEEMIEHIGNSSKDGYAGIPVSPMAQVTPVNLDSSLPSLPSLGSSDSLPPAPGMKEYTELPSEPVMPLTGGLNNSGIVNQGGSLPPAPIAPSNNPQQGQISVSGIQVVSFDDESLSGNTGKEGEAKKLHVSHALPSGAFATAVLMNGVDAPTGGQAKENPVPILMRLVDEGQLPNYYGSDIESCHVTGASWGDMASERVYIRLEKLSCVLSNGSLINEKVQGYVAGEDGKAGLRGRVVSKQGALIARSLFAGVLSGIGDGIASQYQQVNSSALGNVTTIDPDKIVENGLASGAGNALDKIADFWIQRANEIFPVIEVDARRIGEVIFTNEVDLKENFMGNMRDYSDE
jgi:conjugal transfer pilus assembly protein TraB